MILLFRKKKIQTMSEAAAKYLASIYKEPERKGGDVPRERHCSVNTLEIGRLFLEEKAELQRQREKMGTNSETQGGSKDSYDGDSVSRIMTSLSKSDDTASALKELEHNTNRTFTDLLIEQMNKKNLKSAALYRAAQLDRRLFSKMISDREYKPSKDTALSVIFALQLSLSEAEDMLSRAGYTLSHSSKRDIIIEYFLKEKTYNLNDINAVLYKLGQKTIGR